MMTIVPGAVLLLLSLAHRWSSRKRLTVVIVLAVLAQAGYIEPGFRSVAFGDVLASDVCAEPTTSWLPDTLMSA